MPQLADRGSPALPDEQSRPRGSRTAGRPRRLRRGRTRRQGLEVVRRDRLRARKARLGRDVARAVGKARRGLPHAPDGTQGADSELAPGSRLGHLGGVLAARGARPDHVRADDRWLVDLHRHPGNPPRHVPDLFGSRRAALRRNARRPPGPDGRSRRHGRCATARHHHERRSRTLRRGRPRACGEAQARRLGRRDGRFNRRGRGSRVRRRGREPPAFCRSRRQRSRRVPRAVATRVGRRRGDRSDVCSRPSERLHPERPLFRRGCDAPPGEPGRVRQAGTRLDGPALRSDGRVPERGSGGLRLRQQPEGRSRRRGLPGGVLVPRDSSLRT